MSFLWCTQVRIVYGQCSCPVPPFYLGDEQLPMIRSQDGSGFAHTGRTHMLLHRLTGIRHFHLGELFGSEEAHLFVIVVLQHLHKRLISFHIYGAILLCTRQNTT